MTKKLPDLKLCIILDVIGCLSYAVPFLGEFSDLVWAPLSGFIFYFIFGSRLGTMGGIFSFIEELLPGLDFIPTFTIAYFIRKNERLKSEFIPKYLGKPNKDF
ncbi:MAG: hypothetical protein ABIN97_03165 [Ginsengibacter sp.]